MKTSALPRVFAEFVRKLIDADPNRSHDWRLEPTGGNWTLTIPKLDSSGFDVSVVADDEEVSIFTEYGAHQHFTSDGNHEDTVKNAMGLARDLLSENMRVKVFEVRGKSYRFDLECLIDGKWKSDGTTGLFVLPWFGKKTQKFYSNRRMPPRGFANEASGLESP